MANQQNQENQKNPIQNPAQGGEERNFANQPGKERQGGQQNETDEQRRRREDDLKRSESERNRQ